MFAVHPDVRERHTERRFGLRDLVGVVRADVIHAAGMDVERLAEKVPRDRRALDVPAREAIAPWRRPAQQMVFEFALELEPEREVGSIALFAINHHFAAHTY